MHKKGFSTGVFLIPFLFHIYTAAREWPRQAQFFNYLSTTYPRCSYGVVDGVSILPPFAFSALFLSAQAVSGTGDGPWQWVYSMIGKTRKGTQFVIYCFIFGFYVSTFIHFSPQPFASFPLFFPYKFSLQIFMHLSQVNICRFRFPGARRGGLPIAPVRMGG